MLTVPDQPWAHVINPVEELITPAALVLIDQVTSELEEN